jgi:hypothetical protein
MDDANLDPAAAPAAAAAASARPATRTVSLSVPVQLPDAPAGQAPRTQVVLHAPKAGHLRGLKLQPLLEMDLSSHFALWPRISDLTPAEIDCLDAADLSEITSTVMLFFATPQQLQTAAAMLAARQG